MATDYWSSSHHQKWIVDRLTLQRSRQEDLAVESADTLAFLNIFFANLISRIGKKLHFRQRVIATAIVFFRRFYLKNSLCDSDPFMVLTACCYVAGKAEELPAHIKTVISVANPIISELGVWSTALDNHRLAEMEFYLVDELECDLIVFHPYRALTSLCVKESSLKTSPDVAAYTSAPQSTRMADGSEAKYWGTDVGKLVLDEKPLQLAWLIINDTYRTDVCLLYPPFLIAVAAIYLALVNSDRIQPQEVTPDRMSTSPADATAPTPASASGLTPGTVASPAQGIQSTANTNTVTSSSPDPITFLASLNVSLTTVASIAQEMLSFYSLSVRYVDDSGQASTMARTKSNSNEGGLDGFLMDVDGRTPASRSAGEKVRPKQLVEILKKMKLLKEKGLDVSMMSAGAIMSPNTTSSAHHVKGRTGGSGQPVNKRLERAQAAG